jgi:ribosomal protein S12 methylthiotransferase accessory factor YcaO
VKRTGRADAHRRSGHPDGSAPPPWPDSVSGMPTVPAFNLSTGRRAAVPEALVYLNNRESPASAFPTTDSSGTACHATFDAALDAALLEFAERQSLIAGWRLRAPAVVEDMPSSMLSSPTLRQLAQAGTFTVVRPGVFDNCAVAVVMWTATECPENTVRYCIGASAGWSDAEAMDGAVQECEQAYWNMAYNARFERIRSAAFDEIQRSYLLGNATSTADRWAWRRIEPPERARSAEHAPGALLDEICGRTAHLYLAYGWLRVLEGDFHIVRVVSPDYFLSMNDPVTETPTAFAGMGPVRNFDPLPFG